MLHKTVLLANLQVFCPTRNAELNLVAGRIRHLFYAASLPWSDGNLGRVIPVITFEDFYGEYQALQKSVELNTVLTVLPFPAIEYSERALYLYGSARSLSDNAILWAPHYISTALEERFKRRLEMLRDAVLEEKRLYASLLEELEKVIKMGLSIKEDIKPELLSRIEQAKSDILCHSVEAIRRSTSIKEDIINVSGALL